MGFGGTWSLVRGRTGRNGGMFFGGGEVQVVRGFVASWDHGTVSVGYLFC